LKITGWLDGIAVVNQPNRPKILGVAHLAVWVSDVEQTRRFYRDLLGYQGAWQVQNPDGSLALACIKINDRQFVELHPGLKPGEDRLHHFAFYVDDAERMRAYLAARGVAVPTQVTRARIGTTYVSVKDPEGHTVEFVEYTPDSRVARETGKLMGDDRLSLRMSHVGFLVGELAPTMRFYCDILGFAETWRGAHRTSETLSWVNLQLPDSNDYVELMLYSDKPPPNERGLEHHLCLEVPDVTIAHQRLEGRPARKDYPREIAPRTGSNRKRQLNLYDPDGTRVEVMEANTVDGAPAPSSTMPLPRAGLKTVR
jgi:catechol 2,3-dioxygenase-like lactoylglutathione lyase family enzyme